MTAKRFRGSRRQRAVKVPLERVLGDMASALQEHWRVIVAQDRILAALGEIVGNDKLREVLERQAKASAGSPKPEAASS